VTAKYHALDGEYGEERLPDAFKDLVCLEDPSMYDVEEVGPPEVDDHLFQVYSNLKEMGFWVCDGSHYGSDFAIYKEVPGCCHSLALIWVMSGQIDTRKLVQCIRVADSAKKQAIFAVAGHSGVKYISMRHCKEVNPEKSRDKQD
jgi:tRNA splicing endonuclease